MGEVAVQASGKEAAEDWDAMMSAGEAAAKEHLKSLGQVVDKDEPAEDAEDPGEDSPDDTEDNTEDDHENGVEGENHETESTPADVEEEEEPEEPPKKGKEVKSDLRLSKEQKELIEQAKKLGFEVSEGNLRQVTVPERRAFREKMRKKQEQFAQQTAQARAEIEQAARDLLEKNSKVEAATRALAADDLDGFAKAIGFKDIRDLNIHYVKKMSSPEARELAALRQKQQELDEREREKARQEELRARERFEQKQMKEEVEAIREELKEHDDWKKFATDDDFVHTVHVIQRNSWDGQEVVDIEDALIQAKDLAYKKYQQLSKLFGPSTGSNSEQPTAGRAEKKRKRSISRSRASEAAGGEPEELSDVEWAKKYAKLI